MKLEVPDFSALSSEQHALWAIPNEDEAKVRRYTLPDVLMNAEGKKIQHPEEWLKTRRAEVLRLFEDHVYGRMLPPLPFEVVLEEESSLAVGGKGTRRQVELRFSQGNGARFKVILYFPNHRSGPVPCFLGLNFSGNHSAFTEPEVLISDAWFPAREGIVNHRSTEATRGSKASRWPVEMILNRGYAVATLYYGDVDPDFHDGFRNGVHGLFPVEEERPDYAAATITAWAWGLSRVLDYLEQVPEIDAARVALTGHSRLGKTSLWAMVQDERFALAIVNNSGCGGAAIARRNFGETPLIISDRFPHWFCKRYWSYAGDPDTFPFDQHWLLSLAAPRPVMVSSATEDLWADPRGEFLGALHASPVYRLLGEEGLEASEMPAPGEAIYSRIGYSFREGAHDITPEDWVFHLNFADRHLC